jgi:hypothetical protein
MNTRTSLIALTAVAAVAATSFTVTAASAFEGGEMGGYQNGAGFLAPRPIYTPTATSGQVVENCNVNSRLGCAVHIEQTPVSQYPSTPVAENCNCETQASAPPPVYVPPQQTAQPCECEAPKQVYVERPVRVEVPVPYEVKVPVPVPVRVAVPYEVRVPVAVPVRVAVPYAVRVPVPYEVRVPVRVEVPVQESCGCGAPTYSHPTSYPTFPAHPFWPSSTPHRVYY